MSNEQCDQLLATPAAFATAVSSQNSDMCGNEGATVKPAPATGFAPLPSAAVWSSSARALSRVHSERLRRKERRRKRRQRKLASDRKRLERRNQRLRHVYQHAHGLDGEGDEVDDEDDVDLLHTALRAPPNALRRRNLDEDEDEDEDGDANHSVGAHDKADADDATSGSDSVSSSDRSSVMSNVPLGQASGSAASSQIASSQQQVSQQAQASQVQLHRCYHWF